MLLPVYKLDRGDRKELVKDLLARLTAGQQKAWLAWCIGRLDPLYHGTRIEGEIVNENEAWLYFLTLCSQYRLDMAAGIAELQRRVRAVGAKRNIAVSLIQR